MSHLSGRLVQPYLGQGFRRLAGIGLGRVSICPTSLPSGLPMISSTASRFAAMACEGSTSATPRRHRSRRGGPEFVGRLSDKGALGVHGGADGTQGQTR